ncbi:MAG: TolC family protein [Pseudohongiellaceae bacterium]
MQSVRVLYPLLFWLPAVTGLAAQSEHEPLQISTQLQFEQVLESALANAPEIMEGEVRQQQALDYTEVGNSLISGRPSLQMSFYDDRMLDNVGLQEFEYGVQLPLWRPGERQQARRLGQSYTEQVADWELYLALFIAGRLRVVMMDIQEAETLVSLARQATADSRELVRVTEALFDAGEVPRLDLMQAQSLLLAQRKEELEAEAMLIDSEIAYSTLTGLGARPADLYQETLSELDEITSEHPQLQYLQSEVELKDASIHQSEISTLGNPSVTIGTRRERGDRFQTHSDSIGISVSIPFGASSYVSSRVSAARREKVDAEVLYYNSHRKLSKDLHEVEHDLYLNEQALVLSQEQATLAEQRWDMARDAFELGELTLAPVVIALQQSRDSSRQYQQLLLDRQRLITEYNQIIGVMP